MRLADISIIGEAVGRVTEAELDELRTTLGCLLPSGYDEFMLAFGEGVLGGSLVRVYPPWRILGEVLEWRTRIAEYWFWHGVPQAHALESIRGADTLNGDELFFHPSRPDEIWVLPRDSEEALRPGVGLWAALEWLCSAGVLTEPFAEREFVPHDSRRE